jgi:RNA-directed DNA polymerase
VETKLARITEIAKQKRNERFTALAHYINPETLAMSHQSMKSGKASGIDSVTRDEYGSNLDANLADLVSRMKRQAYKPQPARRVYIPKPGSQKQRPLGIPSYEDKLVQRVMAQVLGAIYEADFLNCSFGFRPGRGSHDALKVLGYVLEAKKVSYVVDADIKGFFDHVSHEWMMKFLEHRVADPNFLRLIARFLRAGIMEAGVKYDTPEGTPQGGVISPILANVYLHYVLDLWFEGIFRKQCRGEAYLVRYADDFVCCFQYREDAEAFLASLVERLAKFNLEVAEDKTKIVEFGRFAEERSKGNGKPGTFDFLGFTHYCGKSKKGKFRVKRKTNRKKLNASLKRNKEWLRQNLTLPAKQLMPLLRAKLIGHYRYYGITDNGETISNFGDKVKKQLYWWFNRRSQGKHFNWEKFNLFLRVCPLPRAKVYVSMYDVDPAYLRRGR